MEAKQRLALGREAATGAQGAQGVLEGSSVSIARASRGPQATRRFLNCKNNSHEFSPGGHNQLESQTIDTVGNFYEFFAGAGMARAGLGDRWRCLFANDFDKKKAKIYAHNWGPDNLLCCDVRDVTTSHLTGAAALVWASFPCQDLSLAGGGAGLKGERSGTFWPFWNLMKALADESRAPAVISLENVCGTLSSHSGKDFKAICKALRDGGYRFGALVIDAVHFVPQSRPRLLIVAVRNDVPVPSALCAQEPTGMFHPRSLRNAFGKLPGNLKESWIWWHLPEPPSRSVSLSKFIEENPHDAPWHTEAETTRLMNMMSGVNLEKVRSAMGERRAIGTAYKRTRRDEFGRKVQRAEVRFDDIAGCLRTPAGGSSRQLILFVEGRKVRSRLISSRETARLMGLPDNYILPENYNEAYHLTGDGVVVPVVRFLAEALIEPVVLHAVERSGK
ncbi:MAG: DNA cytosine methyltransferase [Synechococcus sp. SB0662_bin_45]|nr:DNA cytosine methyltransferase [Synechococcus sp. SB0668_bin_13]MYE22176.1 DNA cytosine methyltransferase [Synechococcus sp. SB0662_bin_45]